IAALLWTAALISPPATGEEVNSKLLQCDIGPIAKTYGKTQWLVYSCNDNRTVIIVSAPGNPAMPFYFAFYPQAEGYRSWAKERGVRRRQRLRSMSSKRSPSRISPR